MERELTKGCPQGSCCGPGFWNIQYNSLLNLEFGKRTETMAYTDNLRIAVKAETGREAENNANIEICKITKWLKDNKITFNPSAWGHLNPSSYCDVGRLFYGVFKLWSKLQRKK